MANQDDNNNQEIEKVEDVEVETTKNTSDTDNKKQNNDDGYEKVCFICRRPESVAGKMIELPNHICVCNDCMQKSWGLYGTRCVEFLLGTRANRPFMILYALVAIVGATMELGLMWNIAETFNGLMVIPNLIAVFLLSGVVVRLVKEYFDREGKNV